MPPLPPVTKALMLICTAIFCLQSFVPLISQFFGLWPIASGHFLPWQVITYAFLHGGFDHLLFNMLGLWMFGAELERLWGNRRYYQMLAASVLTAAMAQLLVTFLIGSNAYTVGASGALFGLLLAYALAFPSRRFDLIGFLPMLLMMVPNQMINLLGMGLFFMMITRRDLVPLPPVPVPAKTMVAIFGGLELLLGVFFGGSGVAHFAHLGGMLGAWLLIRHWRSQSSFRGRRR
ncbi:rhomboid family intramembrane serine protease [Ideonella sp. A 288]|uniref:rhomboid family intramembrane serine protease n=1 Tax=Ideonella sp. A 288 TaxID=1962181 RepID=UPI000B4A7041|nr:rhomboid family intramembrane serine protease [Ideonella sp. A 288]